MSVDFSRQNVWDRLGLFLSVGCGLHCLVMAALPFFIGCGHESGCCEQSRGLSFHLVALVLVMMVSTVAFARCCQDFLSRAKLRAGLSLLWAPHLFIGAASYESVITVLGAVLVGWAHLNNLRHRCRS